MYSNSMSLIPVYDDLYSDSETDMDSDVVSDSGVASIQGDWFRVILSIAVTESSYDT